MPFPLVPVAIGAAALWALSRRSSTSSSSSSGPSIVRVDQAVAAAMARETDPGRLTQFASALLQAGYVVEANELFGKAAAMIALQQQGAQSNLIAKGIAALHQGGH